MKESPLQRFINLVKFDQEIIVLERKMQDSQKKIETAQKELQDSQEDLRRLKHHALELRKDVDAKELEMSTLDVQEKEKKKRQDQAANQREYQSLHLEIESLKKSQKLLEEHLLAAWKKLEAAETDLENKKQFFDERTNALNSIITEQMRLAEEVRAEMQDKLKQRDEMQKGIKDDLLEKYALMRSKVPNPVIPVQKESCSACFYKTSQQDLVDLKRGKILQCKDCFRFLYIEPLDIEIPTPES